MPEPKKKVPGSVVVEGGEGGDELLCGCEGVDDAETGAAGVDAGFVDGGGIHAGGEVVADLLLDGGAVGGGCVLEDAPEEVLVVVGELAVDAPGGLVGGDGVVLLPAAAGVLVEVVAGVDGAVEAGEIERGGVGHGLQRLLGGGLGRCACGKEMLVPGRVGGAHGWCPVVSVFES